MTRLEMGELYATQQGVLARRFIGGVLYMSRQMIEGGYPTPTAEQTAWANAVDAASDVTVFANTAVKWGVQHNATMQTIGNGITDSDIDYIVAEAAKIYA